MVCLLLIGALFLATKLVKLSPPVFMTWEGKNVTVIGEVYKKENYCKADKEVSVVYLKLFSVLYNNSQAEVQAKNYRVICYLKTNQIMPKMGSIVRVTGVMQGFDKATNPGQFDAESYYQILKISFRLNQTEIQQQSHTYHRGKEMLYQLRCRCSDIFDKVLPQKDASIMKTMLLGERRAVDEERKDLYQKSGIAHILAISGLHISLIGMSLFSLLRKMGFPIGIYCGLPMVLILLYGCMTGFSVSVIRAVGMFIIHMIGNLCRRTYDMVTAAAVMALLILAEEPLNCYSSSFLLSFGCVFAIALFIPALTRKRLKGERQPKPWVIKIAGGAAISIAMLPLQMRFFYCVPMYSVLLNLLVIPLMSFLLPLGLLLLILGGHESFLTEKVGNLITGILAIYDGACGISEKLPCAFFNTGSPAFIKVAFFFGVMITLMLLQRKLSLKKKWMIVASAVVLLIWPTSQSDSITFLDVGQGDCIHIQSKSGNHYLIDGGSSTVSGVGEYRILPYLKYRGVQEIEAIFITHPDEDHCNGIMELLLLAQKEGIMIRRLCLPDIDKSARTEAYKKVERTALQAAVPVTYFSKGMLLQEGSLSLQCLHPYQGYRTENENAYSLVLLMQCDDFEALFTGDVEEEGEEELIRELLKNKSISVEVLKVAHHGSKYSTSEGFLKTIHPKLAIISCGEDNTYKHPHKETLDRLQREGAAVMTTPQYGAITVEIGEVIEVYGYKK